jgi:L-rhamnonate dehydratase
MAKDPRIRKIEWATLEGKRERNAGCNARLGSHGLTTKVQMARIETDDGNIGIGRARITTEQARRFLGQRIGRLIGNNGVISSDAGLLEYPLWDLAGKLRGLPVYALLNEDLRDVAGFKAPCYDTSLYMDELHIADHDEAAAFIAAEAVSGLDQGHKAFKIKIGRGAMHMPIDEGMHRDIAVIAAVRQAVGDDSRIMVDVNNGYNVNLTKWLLRETAEFNIYWLEEPFHEDRTLFVHLKEWMNSEGLNVLIADGEGESSSHLVEWAGDGIVDVIQYDIFGLGFSGWCRIGPELDAIGARSAPHHWGEPYGNYAAGHLAARILNFEAVEWDESKIPGLDVSAYSIKDGFVQIPRLPGFGIELEEDLFCEAIAQNGYSVEE